MRKQDAPGNNSTISGHVRAEDDIPTGVDKAASNQELDGNVCELTDRRADPTAEDGNPNPETVACEVDDGVARACHDVSGASVDRDVRRQEPRARNLVGLRARVRAQTGSTSTNHGDEKLSSVLHELNDQLSIHRDDGHSRVDGYRRRSRGVVNIPARTRIRSNV